MLGIEFSPPKSLKLKAGWRNVERVKKGIFAQLIVMELMREHRLLTQVSAHGVDIVKFLPPLVVGEEENRLCAGGVGSRDFRGPPVPRGIWGLAKGLVKGALGG